MSLDIKYYSFSPERADKEWEKFDRNSLNSKKDNDELIFDIKMLDLEYGSVSFGDFEDSKIEFIFVDAIQKATNLIKEDNYPTKKEWIRFFENIDNKLIDKICDLIKKELSWSKEEIELAIRDYLKSIRPIVLDLKNNKDTIFISHYAGVLELEPSSSESILIKRAKNIIKKFNI